MLTITNMYYQSDWHDDKKNDLTKRLDLNTNLTLLKNTDLKSYNHHRTQLLHFRTNDLRYNLWTIDWLDDWKMTKIMWQTTWHGITAFNLTHLRDRLLTERPKTTWHIFFATTWIIFAEDKYWLNTYYTYTGPVTDILDTLIIHDLFAREGCICTDHLHFNKHMRFPWFPPHFILFLIFSCLLF